MNLEPLPAVQEFIHANNFLKMLNLETSLLFIKDKYSYHCIQYTMVRVFIFNKKSNELQRFFKISLIALNLPIFNHFLLTRKLGLHAFNPVSYTHLTLPTILRV